MRPIAPIATNGRLDDDVPEIRDAEKRIPVGELVIALRLRNWRHQHEGGKRGHHRGEEDQQRGLRLGTDHAGTLAWTPENVRIVVICKESGVDKIKLYSPTQVTVGSFAGGPFAVVYMLWMNFRALGDEAEARMTLIWGFVFVVAVFAILPVLPEKFPNYVLPVIYSLGARLVAERFHLTKQAIKQSDRYGFQSNWNVFGISVGFLLAFMALAVGFVLGLDEIGLIKL